MPMTRTRSARPAPPTFARNVSPSTTRTTDATKAAVGIGGDSTGPGSTTGGADGAPCDPLAIRSTTTTARTARTAATRLALLMLAIVGAAAVTYAVRRTICG